MQLQSVSSTGFNGSRCDYNDYRHDRRKSRVLLYSAVAALGVRDMVLSKPPVKIFGKNIGGVAGRTAIGLRSIAISAAILGACDVVNALRNRLYKKSGKYENFEDKHPVLSVLGSFAGVLGVIALGGAAVKKGKNLIKPSKKLVNGLTKYAERFNNSNTVAVVKNGLSKLAEKTPKWLKNAGSLGLEVAPFGLFLGALTSGMHNLSKRAYICGKHEGQINSYNNNFDEENFINTARNQLAYAAMTNALAASSANGFVNDVLALNPDEPDVFDYIYDGTRYNMPDEIVEKINNQID